jgi:DNA-binding response OmpR family regulator
MSEPAGPTILLYSDDVDVRAQVRLAIGRRLERGAPDITWLEVATADEVVARFRTAPPDLLIVDGEADKVGGMGVSRQLKDETYDCTPILVLLGRPQDAWLASWSDADAAVSRPLDPIAVREAVVGLLTRSAAAR